MKRDAIHLVVSPGVARFLYTLLEMFLAGQLRAWRIALPRGLRAELEALYDNLAVEITTRQGG